MRYFILYIFLFFSSLGHSQSKHNSIGLGTGFVTDADNLTGFNFEMIYVTEINNFLFLEGNLNYTTLDNFPTNFESGSFSNIQKKFGEFDEKHIVKLNANLHIEFLNKDKNKLSLFAGPSLNFINKTFYFGTNFNGSFQETGDNLGDFLINKEKSMSLGLNFGMLYSYTISENIKIGVKVNGFNSRLIKKDEHVGASAYFFNFLIIKKI